MEDKPRDIADRTFDFSIRIIRMVDALPQKQASWILGKQIIRSATSVDSNIIHARAGISTADFQNHLRVAIKEAKETQRWIEMILGARLVSASSCVQLQQEIKEIIAILVTMNKNTFYSLKK